MKKLKNNERGITLIALIVTIIILLILAGVTIAQLTESGLFNKAKLAEQKSENAQIKEEETLADYENKIGEYVTGSNRNDKTYDKNVYDVWPTWLSLAGIENPESYNGQKILSNESLMQTVMNSEAATEYMLNSREFILPAVLNSEVASTKLWESSKLIKVPKLETNNDQIISDSFVVEYADQWGGYYDLYYAFDQDVNKGASSELPGLSAVGSYIGYDFRKPVNILKVDGKLRMLSYKIQYSDDNQNWSDCIENTSVGSSTGDTFSDMILENHGKHRYWRLYVNGGQQQSNWGAQIWELQFYGF